MLYISAGLLAYWPLRRKKISILVVPVFFVFGCINGFSSSILLAFIVSSLYYYAQIEMSGFVAFLWGLLVASNVGLEATSTWTQII